MTSAYEVGQIPPVLLRHRLRIAREFAGYEQDELAELIGVSRNTIGNAELGRVKPRRITLRAWAFHCEVPLSWIEGGDTMPHPPDGDAEKIAPPSTDQIIDIPRDARVLVVDGEGTVNEEITQKIVPMTQREESVTLRLTAGCAANCATGEDRATLPYLAVAA